MHEVGYSPDERKLLVALDLNPSRNNSPPVTFVPIRNDVNPANKVRLSGGLRLKWSHKYRKFPGRKDRQRKLKDSTSKPIAAKSYT